MLASPAIVVPLGRPGQGLPGSSPTHAAEHIHAPEFVSGGRHVCYCGVDLPIDSPLPGAHLVDPPVHHGSPTGSSPSPRVTPPPAAGQGTQPAASSGVVVSPILSSPQGILNASGSGYAVEVPVDIPGASHHYAAVLQHAEGDDEQAILVEAHSL